MAADLEQPFTPSTSRVSVWHGAGAKLDGMPVRDYPMLLTDRSAVL
jgi:hypothetical protein